MTNCKLRRLNQNICYATVTVDSFKKGRNTAEKARLYGQKGFYMADSNVFGKLEAAGAYQKALDHARIGVVITDPSLEDNPIIYTNQGFMDMTGYSSEEILGKNCRFLQSKETDRQQVAKIRKSLTQKEKITVRLKNVKKTAPHFGMNSTLILFMLKTSSILSVFKRHYRAERIRKAP